ncbi:MAG: tetratricopeptide repeat protein [Planctomycetota bacterium]|nr:tetratricopeptide repeat protein [Planctomycetota bacterium]
MSQTSNTAPSEEGRSDQSTLQYSSPLWQRLGAHLTPLRAALETMPRESACLRCGRSTTGLFPVTVWHDDFHFDFPLSICKKCVRRPEFVTDPDADPRLLPIVPIVLLGGILASRFLWTFPLAMMIAFFTVFWFRKMRPITEERRREFLTPLVCQSPELTRLLAAFPGARITIAPGAVGTRGQRPGDMASVVNETLLLHQRVHVYSTSSDLADSGIPRRILALQITRTCEIIREFSKEFSSDEFDLIQVGQAILPGRRNEFDFQILSLGGADRSAERQSRLEKLPTAPCNYPVAFVVQQNPRGDWLLRSELAPPFHGWYKQEATWTEMPVGELAMNVHNVEFPDPPLQLTADDCLPWVALFPEDDNLTHLRLELLRSEGRSDEAAVIAEQQGSRSSMDPAMRFAYALFLLSANRGEHAAVLCRRLMTENPEFAESYALLAHLQMSFDTPEEALRTIRSAPTEDRSSQFWHTAARVFASVNDFPEAYRCLDAAIKVDPEFLPPYELRPTLLASEGKIAEALAAAELYCDRSGGALKASQMKAEFLKQLGRVEESLEVYSRCLEQQPDHLVLLWLRAETLVDAGKLELARADCERALSGDPKFPPVLVLLAQISLESQDPDAAEQYATAALDSGIELHRAYLVRGIGRLTREDYEAAAADLTRAQELDPENAATYWHLARLRVAQGEVDEALQSLDDAVRVGPLWLEPRLMRGFLRLSLANLDGAAEDFDFVIEANPKSTDAWRGRALVYEKRSDVPRALDALEKALALDPENSDCHLARSRIRMAEYDLESARRDLDAALSSVPNLLPALLSRAQVSLQLGNYEQARRDYDAILRDHPEFTPALIGRSLVWDQTGDSDRSREDLEAAVQSAPEDAHSLEIARLLMKADLARANEEYAEAIAAATEAIEYGPEEMEPYQCRAGAFWYSDQFSEALDDYERALQLCEEPTAGLWNGRGQVLAELGEFELALVDLEKAVAVSRSSERNYLPYCLNGLGKILTGLGRLEEADVAFQESLALQPENAWLQYNLGQFWIARGSVKEAVACFERALRYKKPPLPPGKRAKAQGFIRRSGGSDPVPPTGDPQV